jgi:hypothetical protein
MHGCMDEWTNLGFGWRHTIGRRWEEESHMHSNIRRSTEHCSVLFCSVQYYTVSFCTILFCSVLPYSASTVLLYSILLYCTLLYSTPFYCTVLYSTNICSAMHHYVAYCTARTCCSFVGNFAGFFISILQGGCHSWGGTILQIPYRSACSRILEKIRVKFFGFV